MPVGQVRDPHRRVGRVDALAARACRAVDVDLEVVVVELDVDILGLRHHSHSCGRGVDPPLRLGRRARAGHGGCPLPLEDRVGAVALDREADALKPPVAFGLASSCSHLKPRRSAYRVSIRKTSPAQSAASSPPAAWRISTITSLRVGRIGLDERELQFLLEPRRPVPRAPARARAGRRHSARPRGRKTPPAIPSQACAPPRAPSGAGRPPPLRGGRCRRRGLRGAPAFPRKSARPPRRGRCIAAITERLARSSAERTERDLRAVPRGIGGEEVRAPETTGRREQRRPSERLLAQPERAYRPGPSDHDL